MDTASLSAALKTLILESCLPHGEKRYRHGGEKFNRYSCGIAVSSAVDCNHVPINSAYN